MPNYRLETTEEGDCRILFSGNAQSIVDVRHLEAPLPSNCIIMLNAIYSQSDRFCLGSLVATAIDTTGIQFGAGVFFYPEEISGYLKAVWGVDDPAYATPLLLGVVEGSVAKMKSGYFSKQDLCDLIQIVSGPSGNK